MTQVRNGDNFRMVSADVQADVLTQYYAMEETHPRGRRPYESIAADPRRQGGGRSSLSRDWPEETRAKVRDKMLAWHAERLGILVSEMAIYRYYRDNKHLTEAEAVGAILRSRRSER